MGRSIALTGLAGSLAGLERLQKEDAHQLLPEGGLVRIELFVESGLTSS